MKIKYKFVNDELSEIEVDICFGKIIEDMERKMKNNDRRETKRHLSYNARQSLSGDEFDIIDPRIDIERNYIEKERYERLLEYIETLSIPQQNLVRMLEDGMNIKEISRRTDVGLTAIYKMRERLQKNIKKFLDDHV